MGEAHIYKLIQKRYHRSSSVEVPLSCPIQASLGVLGKKWALGIMRDIVMFERSRFSEIRRANPGLSARLLSMRLQELADDGYISRLETEGHPRYAPTSKGQDVKPILTELLRFGARHYAADLFADGKPRGLEELMAA